MRFFIFFFFKRPREEKYKNIHPTYDKRICRNIIFPSLPAVVYEVKIAKKKKKKLVLIETCSIPIGCRMLQHSHNGRDVT